MANDQYVGATGEALKREYERRNTAASAVDEAALKRDLWIRLPYGRALDQEHLDWMLDESNGRNQAVVMRRRLLAYMRGQLPSGIMTSELERALLAKDSETNPTRPGYTPGIPEWTPGGAR